MNPHQKCLQAKVKIRNNPKREKKTSNKCNLDIQVIVDGDLHPIYFGPHSSFPFFRRKKT